MKLINLLIRELDNYSLGGDFRVSRHAEICQFDRFSLEINFKRARSCKVCLINFEPPDIDFCSACHVYPISRGAWIISVLFMVNRLTWGLNEII